MRKGNLLRMLLAAPLLVGLTAACNTRIYDDCPEDRCVGMWGVLNKSDIFGSDDSIYYVINPIGNISDSLYFNANYTDSYYRADSTRVSFAYGPGDSLRFYIQRMYSVEVNPTTIIAEVRVADDTVKTPRCVLTLTRIGSTDEMYVADRDTVFLSLLRAEKPLLFAAHNGPSTSGSEGSQNYTWIMYTEGFNRAVALRDSLNDPQKYRVKDKEEKKDSGSHADKEKKHHSKKHHIL